MGSETCARKSPPCRSDATPSQEQAMLIPVVTEIRAPRPREPRTW
jgi:hypothetical protein